MKYQVHRNAITTSGRRLVFSEKQQIWMRFMGYDESYLRELSKLRDMYFHARTAENINRISTFEMEQAWNSGESMPKYERKR